MISEEQKFLRLCGDEYKQKIKKQSTMSLQDFQKFTYLIDYLEFSEYNLYFCMEMFPDLLRRVDTDVESDYWNDEYDIEFSDYTRLDVLINECDMWLEEFCNQMPLENQRKKYRQLFDISDDKNI